MKRTDKKLVDLMEQLTEGQTIYLTGDTDEGYADLAISWEPGEFWVSVETFIEGRTYPATLYQPAETDWIPVDCEVKTIAGNINNVAKWLNQFDVNLAWMEVKK
jgi:hypothetical protein